MSENHDSIRTYTIIFIWLVVLMFLTILASFLNLGPLNLTVAMVIAIIKATLVVLYFMHVKYSGRLVWIWSAGAFLWLGIMLTLTFTDYLSRGWVPQRLPSEPVAGLFRPPQPLAESAPAPQPSGQTLPNPAARPRVDLAPPVTTEPGAQPSGID